MAGIGAVFVLWLAVLIAPYAEGGLPGILLNMNEITAHPFRLEFCADTGKAVGIFLGGYALMLLYIFGSQKNFRHGEEHGSAKWENVYLLNHRLHDKEHPDENRILSRHLSITTDQRKLDKNLFTLVIGGSGSRKTRAYVKPNLLQCNSSYIIMDPKGELLRDIGNVFKAEGYKIRVFDLIDMLSSFRYNPFVYFKRESDIQGFITNLFANTEDKTKHGGDAFWDKTAKMMLSALMYYVWYECPETEMNFGTVMELILAETVEEGDEAGVSATQVLIEELRARSPRHIAVRYFDAYRKGAGETIMSIQESLLSRLEKFLLEDVVNLTTGDDRRRKNGAVYPHAGRQQFPFPGIGAYHAAFSAYDGTGRCTQHRRLTRAGAFCARGSAKYYVAGQLPKLGCDDAFAQHHIIDYSAKYIADQAYVPGRLGVRVRHVR